MILFLFIVFAVAYAVFGILLWGSTMLGPALLVFSLILASIAGYGIGRRIG